MSVEESSQIQLDFQKLRHISMSHASVIPVVVQDVKTMAVLIVAYANHEALNYTLTKRKAAFWSTSRDELWVKGATSGNELHVVDVRVNCEQNSLLYLVNVMGSGVCHSIDSTGSYRPTCYYRSISHSDNELKFI